MRNPNKINWTSEVWQQYIEEALETAKGMKKLGCCAESVDAWLKIAEQRELEYKNLKKPQILYQ